MNTARVSRIGGKQQPEIWKCAVPVAGTCRGQSYRSHGSTSVSWGEKRMYNSRCAVKLLFMLCCMLMAMHHHARSSFAETAGQQPAAGEAKSDAAEGAAKDGQESRRPLIARNINRIQYRVPLNDGESSLQQGSFIQFNNQFFIAEYVELLSQPGKGADMEDPNYNFELTAGRPLMPGHETGKIIRWLGRIQASTGETTVFSAGVQWDITDSAAIRDLARSWKMSCFIQVFPLKTHPRDNGMDVYAWLQLKNLSSWF